MTSAHLPLMPVHADDAGNPSWSRAVNRFYLRFLIGLARALGSRRHHVSDEGRLEVNLGWIDIGFHVSEFVMPDIPSFVALQLAVCAARLLILMVRCYLTPEQPII